MTNKRVRNALAHSWELITDKGPKKCMLMAMPNGFGTRTDYPTIRQRHKDQREATTIERSCKDIGVCVFLTPTSEKPYCSPDWQSCAMAATATARVGGDLVALVHAANRYVVKMGRVCTTPSSSREYASAMRHNGLTLYAPYRP
ncbi:unnamed protein product [Nippostrongylus brasiliensis]|uniref:Transposase n=1 Tax=Nippostrongylus brasiliensis TaxID=27835 RepID=A0A0N4Y6Z3_NIPBR|nr:unnamed protein product [Nippostrongylus brasiliensis]